MDVHARLAELRQAVEGARSMPMSASAVINRCEVLVLVDGLEKALDAALLLELACALGEFVGDLLVLAQRPSGDPCGYGGEEGDHDLAVMQLVEKGKAQVTMARMLGKFAVEQGRGEATKAAGRVGLASISVS